MRTAALVLACALGANCRSAPPAEGEILLTVRRPQLDPADLRAPLAAVRCRFGEGLLLRGVADLQGALVWLVTEGAPDTGAFPVHAAAAAVPGRHARVSVRYVTGDAAQALSLDSGTVTVHAQASSLSGGIGASGAEPGGGPRVFVEATFRGVPVAADSEPCRTRSS